MSGRRKYFKNVILKSGIVTRVFSVRFRHAVANQIIKVITLVGSNQCNYFKNATAYSKRTLKLRVATQLYCGKCMHKYQVATWLY